MEMGASDLGWKKPLMWSRQIQMKIALDIGDNDEMIQMTPKLLCKELKEMFMRASLSQSLRSVPLSPDSSPLSASLRKSS
ncbi:hypothetical protein Bca4012_099513 [Brassica carinata]